jgi:tRNA-splicing ligase RtcB (3'-phosphate/5'-hydroxy nucleic acid ligase)
MIPPKGAIVPSAVGVDIGCGMVAVETQLVASACRQPRGYPQRH